MNQPGDVEYSAKQLRGFRSNGIRQRCGFIVFLGLSVLTSGCNDAQSLPANEPGETLVVRAANTSPFNNPRTSKSAAKRPVVLAHYMPWFRKETQADGNTIWEHWSWMGPGTKHDPNTIGDNGRRDIASIYYPLIEPYDSRDPIVIEYHILTARAAGIDGFVCDWYGPGSFTDDVFRRMVKIAERLDFKIAICMEEKTFFPPYCQISDRSGAVQEMKRQLTQINQHYLSSPAYLKSGLSSIVFVFNHWGESDFGPNYLLPEETRQAMDGFADSVVLTRVRLQEEYFTVAKGIYDWCGPVANRKRFLEQALAQKQKGAIEYSVAAVSPGFDDSGVNGWGEKIRRTPRRGSDEYNENWDLVISKNSDQVQIVTWNDFQEGTTIEPTFEYGFDFVNLTEQFVEQFNQRPNVPEDNRLGFDVFKLRHLVIQCQDAAQQNSFNRRLNEVAGQIGRSSNLRRNSSLSQLRDSLTQLESEIRTAARSR